MDSITTKDVSLKELVQNTRRRKIPRILLTDYATVKPVRKGRSTIMTPMLRVVATVFDREHDTIFRWQEEKESSQMVTIIAGSGRGPNRDSSLATRKEEVRQVLRDEGFEVDEGEWTPASVRASLDARRRVIG